MATTSSISPFLQGFDHKTGIPAVSESLAPSFSSSSLGINFFGHISNTFASFRTWLALPHPGWTASPFCPDNGIGFQFLGVTTLVHAFFGPFNVWNAVCAQTKSAWEKFYKALNVVACLGQTGLGFTYGVFRTANIAQAVTTAQGNIAAAASWGSIAKTAGIGGNIAGFFLYAPLAINGAARGIESATCFRGVNRATYLKGQYEATIEELIEEKGSAEMLRMAARTEAFAKQKELWKGGLAFMKKHGVCNQDAELPSGEALEKAIRAKLGGENNLVKYGEKLLLEGLQKRKITNLTMLIGRKGVEELETTRRADGTLDESRITLSEIESSRSGKTWRYAQEFFIYALGAVSMVLLCVCTGGTPLLIASILAAATFTGETWLSYQDLRDARDNKAVLPGKYDKVWPVVSSAICLGMIGTGFALSSVFSLGIAPLALAGVGGLLWLTMNAYHVGCINEKRRKYIASLLKLKRKGTLQAAEFAYIAAYGTPYQVARAWREKWLDPMQRRAIVQIGNIGPQDFNIKCLREATEKYIVDTKVTWLQRELQHSLVI